MNAEYVYTEGLDSISKTFYYEALRDKLYILVDGLKKSIDSLERVDQDISSSYSVDEGKVDGVLTSEIRDELNSRLNYLNYTIIPLINSKINNLN